MSKRTTAPKASRFDPAWKFEVDEEFVRIPGHGGGPDGPFEPDDPDQLAWMREHSGLEEAYALTWRFEWNRWKFLQFLEQWRNQGP